MTKQDRQKRIDSSEATAEGTLSAIGYRPVNETTPPVPAGFSVTDAVEQVICNIDFDEDTAHDAPNFGHFVVSRVREVDSTGEPVGIPERVAFFNSSSKSIARMPNDSQIYWYAAQARSLTGAIYSGYTTWVPGIFLSDSGISDRFDTYGGSAFSINDDANLGYLQIAEIEEDEGWLSAADDLPNDLVWQSNNTTYVRFGDDALELEVPAAGTTPAWNVYYPFGSTIDFTAENRFTSADYVTLKIYREGANATNFDLYIAFYTTKDTHFYSDTFQTTGSLAEGYIIRLKQSDFSSTGSPSWSTINGVQLTWGYAPGGTPLPTTDSVFVDDLKLSKADPDDSTTDNVTGGVWKPYPVNSTSAVDDYYMSITTDFPGEDFGLGLPRVKSTVGQYLAMRPGTQISNGVWAGSVYLNDGNGAAGIMARVQPPWKTLETPVINVMFDQSDDEAVFQTHTPTSSGITYSQTTARGVFAEFTSGDELSYASVTLPNTRNQFTIHTSIRADFASTDGSNHSIVQHYVDANNNVHLLYIQASDVWRMAVTIAGSTTTLDSSAQSFASTAEFTITGVVDDQTVILYVNGVEEDRADLAANYSSSSGTLYVSNNQASGQDWVGRIYQVFIDREVWTSSEILAAYTALFSNNRLARRVATLGQYDYYLLSINATGNTVDLEKYYYDHNLSEGIALNESLSKTIDSDVVYHLGLKCENTDTDNDGNADQVDLVAWVSTTTSGLFTGDSQVFNLSEADANYPIYSGGVGVWSNHTNARFANIRAGSPARAEEAERAMYARRAKLAEGLTTVSCTPRTFHTGIGAPSLGSITIGTNLEARIWQFDAAADESAVRSIQAPISGNTVSIDYYWAMDSATSNDVVLMVEGQAISPGNVTTAGSDTRVTSTETVPGTADTLVKTTMDISLTYLENDLIILGVGRLGTNGSDTATGNLDMYHIDVRLS